MLRVIALIIFWGFVSIAYARSAEVEPNVGPVSGPTYTAFWASP
jgi:hypothetical protein